MQVRKKKSVVLRCHGAAAVFIMMALSGSVFAQETPEFAMTDFRTVTKLEKSDAATAGMDAAALDRIAAVMESAIDDRQVSGGVVLVGRRGIIVYEQAFGYRSIEPTTESATLDTIYDLASLTKCVATASAVMKLVEEGKIRLGEDVEDLLPEWKPSKEEEEKQQEISRLRQWIRLGGLRFNENMLSAHDVKSTAIRVQKDSTRSPAAVWKRMMASGEIRPSDRFIDEIVNFGQPDRTDVTLRHLLTHTSGLDSYDNYYVKFPEGNARRQIIENIATRKMRAAAGEKFIYSDLGFITLGEIVERVSGQSLEEFCRQRIFEPLGMRDTMFTPPPELQERIAPTEWRAGREIEAKEALTEGESDEKPTTGPKRYMIRGEVHDGNALVQNGVSGHAGLFSTARDLAVFCQMLLNEGVYDGKRIFSPLTMRAMTSDQARLESGQQRGYGWDVKTGYSAQRGDIFSSGFGHTGWTGTSLWVVPEEELFIIILSNRVHPDGTGNAGPIRSKIANVVASSILEPSGANRKTDSND